jgi:hypothetical protein
MPLPTAPPDTVDALACDYARLVLDHDPVSATALGIHDRDAELPPVTASSLDAYRRDLAALRERIGAFAAEGEAELDRRGLLALVTAQHDSLEVLREHERNPLTWAQHPASALLLLVVRPEAAGEGYRRAVAERAAAVPGYLASARALLNPDAVPAPWAHAAQGAALGSAAFFQSVLPEAVPEAEAGALAAARSLTDFAAWLESDVVPKAAGEFAVGEAHLGRMLASHHLLDDSPSQLAERGRRLGARFEEMMADLAGDRDWRERLEAIKRSHPDADGLLPAYRQEFERLREYCFAEDLVSDPDAPAELTATPEFLRPIMGYAAYLPPGPFDTRAAGQLWITPPTDEAGLRDHAYANLAPVTAHEGYPGHHLQLTSVNRLPSAVRKLQISTLMVEGWGLYVEELMAEVGYYDADARLAQLSMSNLRAIRIELDMGLHAGELTLDQAAAQLRDRAGLSEGVARSEALRYTMMPTQASTYLIGAEEIRRIRAALRDAEPAFSLRSFHDRLLGYGHLPPALAAEGLGA